MKKILYTVTSLFILSLCACNEYSVIEGISYETEEETEDYSRLTLGSPDSKNFYSNQLRFTVYFRNDAEVGEVTYTYTISGIAHDKIVKKSRKYYPNGLQTCSDYIESTADFTIPAAYINSTFVISYTAKTTSGLEWTGERTNLSADRCYGVWLTH